MNVQIKDQGSINFIDELDCGQIKRGHSNASNNTTKNCVGNSMLTKKYVFVKFLHGYENWWHKEAKIQIK